MTGPPLRGSSEATAEVGKPCPTCNGSGTELVTWDTGLAPYEDSCPDCRGTGKRDPSADSETRHTDLEAEVDRLRDIIARAARLAESERAGMALQVLREIDQEANHG